MSGSGSSRAVGAFASSSSSSSSASSAAAAAAVAAGASSTGAHPTAAHFLFDSAAVNYAVISSELDRLLRESVPQGVTSIPQRPEDVLQKRVALLHEQAAEAVQQRGREPSSVQAVVDKFQCDVQPVLQAYREAMQGQAPEGPLFNSVAKKANAAIERLFWRASNVVLA